MRIALCQINPTIGDLDGNARLIEAQARRASDLGARIAVFPELALCGYPPRDLLERTSFLDAQSEALDQLVTRLPRDLYVIIGCVRPTERPRGRRATNSAAVVAHHRIQHVVHKQLLPSYDVFDEDRYFEPGPSATSVLIDGVRVGITICEDLWNDVVVSPSLQRHYHANPVEQLMQSETGQKAEVLVNLSASPFTIAKPTLRDEMLSRIAQRHGVPLVFVNQVGGNDELIFDGASRVYGPTGECWAAAAAFEQDLVVTDLSGHDRPSRPPLPTETHSADAALLDALTLGTRDYARKCGFDNALLGLSGGIDSAVTACIAARALGPQRVLGVALPSRYSSEGSVRDARQLAEQLGIAWRIISIDDLFQQYLDTLQPVLHGLHQDSAHDISADDQDVNQDITQDVTWENVQSRIRGTTLMALSNRGGHLLLSTGNKSEVAMGYCTLYGDMAGGLAVISDVPKTWVYRLAHEINRQAGRPLIPSATLTKPPSAELRPDQKDEDTLPPYDILDAIVARYVEEGMSAADIVHAGFDPQVVQFVVSNIRRSEYKRWQMPPGLKVTRKAFGSGRRYPLAQGFIDAIVSPSTHR